jgi:hypothetical protein
VRRLASVPAQHQVRAQEAQHQARCRTAVTYRLSEPSSHHLSVAVALHPASAPGQSRARALRRLAQAWAPQASLPKNLPLAVRLALGPRPSQALARVLALVAALLRLAAHSAQARVSEGAAWVRAPTAWSAH